jgi:hypothetical protein
MITLYSPAVDRIAGSEALLLFAELPGHGR